MPQVIEQKDKANEHRIQVKADNGNITYASSEGYRNLQDARNTAINTAIQLLQHYHDRDTLNQDQRLRVETLCYNILKDE